MGPFTKGPLAKVFLELGFGVQGSTLYTLEKGLLLVLVVVVVVAASESLHFRVEIICQNAQMIRIQILVRKISSPSSL
jgi:hypothetical protein